MLDLERPQSQLKGPVGLPKRMEQRKLVMDESVYGLVFVTDIATFLFTALERVRASERDRETERERESERERERERQTDRQTDRHRQRVSLLRHIDALRGSLRPSEAP